MLYPPLTRKIRVLAAALFRIWLECRKIQRKWPPRCARRQMRIIYRQYAKSRQRAVSVEKSILFRLRLFENSRPCGRAFSNCIVMPQN